MIARIEMPTHEHIGRMTGILKFRIAISIAFMLGSFFGQRIFAQEFTASVDKNQVTTGEQIQVTFTLNGSSGGNNFQAPAFSDFLVLSGPNQSTSMQFINGSMSASVSYSYVLQSRAEGKFTIGPAAIEVGGKQLRSQPIAIVVSKGAARPSQPRTSGQQAESQDIGKQIGDNLFLKVIVDKARVCQGEQITATYKIYTRVNIANYAISKVPALTGFWSEDLEVPKQIQLNNEVVNGKQYRVGVLKKVALFPQRSGTLELDPMEAECVVQIQLRRRSGDLFDQFFNDPFFGNVQNVNYKVRSEPLKVSVLPLPGENVPAGFSGAVGQYSMDAWLDKHQTKTNEAVTLKVKLNGHGNLKLIEAPAVNVPPDLDRYDPKISDNITNQGNQISGSRTFEYLLIPRHPGQQKIASFPFSFYDAEKKTYVTLRSPEFSLNVEQGSELGSAPVAGVSKEDVKLLGEDIRFIKSGSYTFHRSGERFMDSPMFVVFSVSPIIAFVGFVLYVRRRERVLGDVRALRNRRARKIAQKRLTEAKGFLEAKKKEEFYTEVSRALWGFVSDKLGLPQSDLSLEMVRVSLETRGVPTEVILKLSTIVEQCEYARFAPSVDSMRMDEVYNEAVAIISSIEEQMR